MTTVTLQGNPLHLNGAVPAKGSKAPDFTLTNKDLADVSLKDFAGKRKVLNIEPRHPDLPKVDPRIQRKGLGHEQHRGAGDRR